MASNPADFKTAVACSLHRNLEELNDEFCDVVIAVKGKKIRFHRTVLCLTSQKLRTQLQADFQKVPHNFTIEDEDVSSESVKYLKEILYKGKDLINQETAKGIFKLADYFEIDWLIQHCENFFLTSLQPKDCMDVWLLAQKNKLPDLVDKACKMAAQNISKMRTKLLALPSSMLMMLLSLQTKLSSNDVCKTILRWMEHDSKDRNDEVTQLLPFIQLESLSQRYLLDLLNYPNHPSLGVLFEDVQNTLRRYSSKGRKNTSLPVAIWTKNTTSGHRIMQEAWPDSEDPRVLAFSDTETEPVFASCTWRNVIYLCGCATLNGNFFVAFNPADTKCERFEGWVGDSQDIHAMVAINYSIYTLGTKKSPNVKPLSTEVMKFDLRSKIWSRCHCQLPVSVCGMTVAVLGHRIYVFGGVDAKGKDTFLVQCVDTRGDNAYIAGQLPFSAVRSQAITNGGIIYIVLLTGEVLQMWENFELAEEREKTLATQRLGNVTMQEAADVPESPPTIEFREVKKISARDDFAACMIGSEIRVYGGKDDKGFRLCDCTKINIVTGDVKREEIPRSSRSRLSAAFILHVINIPLKRLQITQLSNEPVEVPVVQDPPAGRFSPVPGPSRQTAHEDNRRRLSPLYPPPAYSDLEDYQGKWSPPPPPPAHSDEEDNRGRLPRPGRQKHRMAETSPRSGSTSGTQKRSPLKKQRKQ